MKYRISTGLGRMAMCEREDELTVRLSRDVRSYYGSIAATTGIPVEVVLSNVLRIFMNENRHAEGKIKIVSQW